MFTCVFIDLRPIAILRKACDIYSVRSRSKPHREFALFGQQVSRARLATVAPVQPRFGKRISDDLEIMIGRCPVVTGY